MTEMAEALNIPEAFDERDLSDIVTEDDTPADSIFSEKQQRLLVGSLYTAWKPGRPFIASANVGIFRVTHESPIVPDMFLSMDTVLPDDPWPKGNRCYFLEKYGKPPEVVVEVVSDREGERGKNFEKYARIGVLYYIVFDPQKVIQPECLRVYELRGSRYVLRRSRRFAGIGLGVTLWDGVFEYMNTKWLRWCDLEGWVIPVASETRQQAEYAYWQAEAECAEQRADQAEQRADQLAARLWELGIDPD